MRPGQVLMVAEKPSVAKLIAEFLSGGRMRFRKGQELCELLMFSRASWTLESLKEFSI